MLCSLYAQWNLNNACMCICSFNVTKGTIYSRSYVMPSRYSGSMICMSFAKQHMHYYYTTYMNTNEYIPMVPCFSLFSQFHCKLFTNLFVYFNWSNSQCMRINFNYKFSKKTHFRECS